MGRLGEKHKNGIDRYCFIPDHPCGLKTRFFNKKGVFILVF